MSKEPKIEKQSVEKNAKAIWVTPEVIDLDIAGATQNSAVKTASAPDGGPGFADYNS